jgi:hypothetical protein
VDAAPEARALAAGATLAAPVAPAEAIGEAPVALVVPVVDEPVVQAALVFAAPAAPGEAAVEAALTADGRADANVAGAALVAPLTPVPAEAAALGRAEVVAAGALAPVPALALAAGLPAALGGPACCALPQAASAKEAAASKRITGLRLMESSEVWGKGSHKSGHWCV